MKRKQLWKVLGTGCLAVSLLASPMTGVSALAADGDLGTEDAQAGTGTDATDKKEGGSALKLDPTRTEAIPESGSEADGDYVPAKPAYADVEIPVYGFTQDSIVYSVDVEWGAMTFQYENSTWDPETHKSKEGKGWQVYDSEADKVVVNDDGTKVEAHAINEIKVTNHSNAGVWATLTYAGDTGYTDITGSFKKGNETGDTTALTAATTDGSVPAYLTLGTADNAETEGAAGTPTVGKAYFMPTDPAEGETAPSNIDKWTEIGKITVGIKTEVPKAATTTP